MPFMSDLHNASEEYANLSMEVQMQPMYLEQNYGLMVFAAVVIGSAAIIGTLGNILIIVTISCVRFLKTPGNMFVLNLALADLVVTFLIDPFNVIGAVAGRRVLMHNHTLCDWIASFCAPACISCMWSWFGISFNRYFLICQPHLYPRIFTYPKTILMCVGIWVMSHLLHLPNHVGWGRNKFNTDYYVCTFDIALYSYAVFYVCLGVLVPLAGTLFGYLKIYLKVRSSRLQLRLHYKMALTSRASKDGSVAVTVPPRPRRPGYTQDDLILAKALFTTFVIYLICWMPFSLFVLFDQPSVIPQWIYVVTIILAHANSAVNPILYGVINTRFREGYRQVLGLQNNTIKPGGQRLFNVTPKQEKGRNAEDPESVTCFKDPRTVT